MPASISLRIILGVRVTGPMVQTILECREIISASRFPSLPDLSGDGKLSDDSCDQIHALGECCQRQPLVVAMHSPVILLGHREGSQTVGLHVVQAQLRA